MGIAGVNASKPAAGVGRDGAARSDPDPGPTPVEAVASRTKEPDESAAPLARGHGRATRGQRRCTTRQPQLSLPGAHGPSAALSRAAGGLALATLASWSRTLVAKAWLPSASAST